jgi:hypothetical protein
MTKTTLLAASCVLAIVGSIHSVSAFPAAPGLKPAGTNIQNVTFWGEAFPYGYRWSLNRACTAYETVETPRGPEMRRVWVCSVHGRREAVVSYRN